MKRIVSKPLHYFILAAVLMWIKSYVAYKTEFNLGVSGVMQQMLLFINPVSSVLIFLGIGLFFKGKKSGAWILAGSFIMTLLLYSNILYYRF